jgi:hypothetical protein
MVGKQYEKSENVALWSSAVSIRERDTYRKGDGELHTSRPGGGVNWSFANYPFKVDDLPQSPDPPPKIAKVFAKISLRPCSRLAWVFRGCLASEQTSRLFRLNQSCCMASLTPFRLRPGLLDDGRSSSASSIGSPELGNTGVNLLVT